MRHKFDSHGEKKWINENTKLSAIDLTLDEMKIPNANRDIPEPKIKRTPVKVL